MKSILSSITVAAALLATAAPAQAELVLTFGGDLNLNQSRQQIGPNGTSKYNQSFTWPQLYSGLAPLLIGDLNFANIETVVSDQRNLTEAPSPGGNGRAFVFRAPPEGIAYGMKIGLNLFSLANNHTADYGTAGMAETMFHMYELSRSHKFWESGLTASRSEASKPALVTVNTGNGPVRIAFLAMTATHGSLERTQAREMGMGILAFYNEADFSAAMASLRSTPADYRILSVHWGREGTVEIEPRQRQMAHRALREGNVDLILGHHPHRVHPVEKVGNKMIFYSLGNYLMVGGAPLNDKSPAHDYGLMGRLYLTADQSGKLVPQALEAIPLTDVHAQTKPMPQAKAHERIRILNQLGSQQLGSNVLEFQKGRLGGVSCLGTDPGRKASALCR